MGCSFKYGTAALAARGPAGREVVGVERDPDHLKEAGVRHPWLRVMPGDANALPVTDGRADAVLLLDVIEHIAVPARALSEAARVVRPPLPPLEAATETGGGPG